MPSVQDLIANVLRTQIPTLMASTGLQYKLITSGPGVEPRAWSASWTALVGQFQKKLVSQTMSDNSGSWIIRRRAHLTVSDAAVALPEGSLVGISGEDPFSISAIEDPHQVRPGLITYMCIRDEPLLTDNGRSGGV